MALSIYSLGYARGYYGRKNVGVLAAFFNLLLLATTLVFLADNAFFFLIAWEIMALTAYCLVSFEHEREETRRAGVLFFVMSHVGTGCLILGFLLLAATSGDYGFDSFQSLGGKLSTGRRDLVFVLFLFGFGVKAGVVPVSSCSGTASRTMWWGCSRFDRLGLPVEGLGNFLRHVQV